MRMITSVQPSKSRKGRRDKEEYAPVLIDWRNFTDFVKSHTGYWLLRARDATLLEFKIPPSRMQRLPRQSHCQIFPIGIAIPQHLSISPRSNLRGTSFWPTWEKWVGTRW